MKGNAILADKALERRIKKHIHAQLHTVECSIPPGFVELGKRFVETLLTGHTSSDPQAQTKVEIHGNNVRIENLPFDAVHELLFEGLVFSDIKIRILRSRCSAESKLEKIVSETDWQLWLPVVDGKSLDVRVDSLNSQLYHEGRIKRLFLDTLSKIKFQGKNETARSEKGEPVALDITLEREVLEIFVSLGGRSFWKRGHKQTFQHAAPLREDIASCLVQRLAEISKEQLGIETPSHVLNPFCGTGTLLHESALSITKCSQLLSEISRWSYPCLPFFKEKSFAHVRKKKLGNLEQAMSGSVKSVSFFGEDLDPALCTATAKWFAEAQARIPIKAEAASFLVDSCKPNMHLAKVSSGDCLWILANPPFGIRMSNESRGGSEKLYQQFGSRLADMMLSLSRKNGKACGVVLCPSEETWRAIQKELRQLRQICEHLTLGGLDIRAIYFTNLNRS